MKNFFLNKIAVMAVSFLAFILFAPQPAYAQTLKNTNNEYTVKAQAEFGKLQIISYSEHWDEANINALYKELLNNFHGEEFAFLSKIYLYPDSPFGTMGHYYDDVHISDKGKYYFGNGSYIELFNMDKRITVEAAAPVLSHEYGHHYTIFNIIKSENKFYPSWEQTQYATIRDLKKYPVVYTPWEDSYSHMWDVTEIAANDYVQLLGSPLARSAWNYLDAYEMLETNGEEAYSPVCFNIRPQENYKLPLATDVSGLYNYLLNIGGYTAKQPNLNTKPEITSLIVEDAFIDHKYILSWSNAIGNTVSYHYTVVLYPLETPSLVRAIKTVKDGEDLVAVFGTVEKVDKNGIISYISETYSGIYVIKVYAQDEKGILFSSAPLLFDFDSNLSYIYDKPVDTFVNEKQPVEPKTTVSTKPIIATKPVRGVKPVVAAKSTQVKFTQAITLTTADFINFESNLSHLNLITTYYPCYVLDLKKEKLSVKGLVNHARNRYGYY